MIEANGWVLKKNGFYQKDDQELPLNIQTHEAFIEKRCIAEMIVEQLRKAALSITMSLPLPRGERERERSQGTAFEAWGLRNRSELRFRAHMRLRAGPSSDFERRHSVLERPASSSSDFERQSSVFERPTHPLQTLLEPTQNKILFVGNPMRKWNQHIT